MSLRSALKAIEPRIEFVLAGASPSGKTQLWEAIIAGGTILGVVAWFGRWRCYAFWPHQHTVFDRGCLREIADFCERVTYAKRKKGSPPAHQWRRKVSPFWVVKIGRNMARDRRAATQLRSRGWSVLRFWSKDIDKDPERCVRRILTARAARGRLRNVQT